MFPLYVAMCLPFHSIHWLSYLTTTKIYVICQQNITIKLSKMSTTQDEKCDKITLLTGCDDIYSGVTVDQNLLAKTSTLFERQLEQSLIAWRQAKRRGIWLSIPHDRTELIPIAQKFGFILHHAKPEYVMLAHWLDESDPNQLPSYAMSTVGVSGLVVNKNREVLLIQERFTHVKDYFTIPGGCLDMGESIEHGVEREVFEETGIHAHFRGILAFTYKAQFRFGHGDVHFACLMSLDENKEDQNIKFDSLEIGACKWMSLEEWANSPEKHPLRVTLHLARLAIDILDGREQLLEPDRIEVQLSNPNRPIWDIMMYRKKSSDKK
ncbi:unnamed protein product [Didymodactylos carnosus]|uniref:Nudix hydrolase domain-containing protein n=1 Tax=Didymodactylos carnosus TaxID=1234261 RepID=A0A814YW35_9BILA|nr:unnamed protein product [Didymodactylos carnosus]CAF3996319.1 unnamed protein product [Didymodactylos carnosus]